MHTGIPSLFDELYRCQDQVFETGRSSNSCCVFLLLWIRTAYPYLRGNKCLVCDVKLWLNDRVSGAL